MEKTCGVLLAAMLIAFMTAYGSTSLSDNGVNVDHSGNVSPENFVMLDTEGQPENEYTANILQPESGTLLRGWIDPDQEHYYLELSDMTQFKSEQYIKTLKEPGFSEVEKASEETNGDCISVGILLTKDSTTVSISYTDDLFGMYTKNEQQQLKCVFEYLLPKAA